MQEDKWQHRYDVGNNITFAVVFIGCWIFCIATGGFLFGVGLGWIPAFICATLARTLLLPVIIFAFGGAILLALGFYIFSPKFLDNSPLMTFCAIFGVCAVISDYHNLTKKTTQPVDPPAQATQTTYWPSSTSKELLVCSDCNFTIKEKEFKEDALFCPICSGLLSME